MPVTRHAAKMQTSKPNSPGRHLLTNTATTADLDVLPEKLMEKLAADMESELARLKASHATFEANTQ